MSDNECNHHIDIDDGASQGRCRYCGVWFNVQIHYPRGRS